MKSKIISSLLAICLLLGGCSSTDEKDQWWNQPEKLRKAGIAAIGSSSDEERELAKKEALTNAYQKLANILESRIKSLTKKISQRTSKESKKLTKGNTQAISQAAIVGARPKKYERDPQTGTMYCLLVLENPRQLMKTYKKHITELYPEKDARGIIDQLIEEEEKRMEEDRQKILKMVK